MVDERGNKTAAIIDLRRHARLWEDFYDALPAQSRVHEPCESLDEVRRRLRLKPRRNGRLFDHLCAVGPERIWQSSASPGGSNSGRIESLANSPRPPGSTKLRGVRNLWRVRVGDYRVIYSNDEAAKTIDVPS